MSVCFSSSFFFLSCFPRTFVCIKHWGAFRDSELHKFAYSSITEWECSGCKHINDMSSKTCNKSKISVLIQNQAGGGGGAAGAGGHVLFGQQQNHETVMEIEDDEILGWFQGKLLSKNEVIQFYNQNNQIIQGRIINIKKCGKRKKNSGQIRVRDVKCEVLLLSSDGIQGLDLS